MRMTSAEYNDWLARTWPSTRDFVAAKEIWDASAESDLHQQIIDHCKRKGWYFVHSRMDKPSTNGVGTPDFVILMDGGRTACIECKRKGSKPTPAQLAAQAQLRHLGHKAEVIYSYEQFLEVIKP